MKASAFVQWLRAQLGKGYVYGTMGQLCTISLLQGRQKAYGTTMGVGYYHLNNDYTKGLCARWLGKTVFDCSGLIKAGRKALTGTMDDISSQGMYSASGIRGSIQTMPLMPGVGVYIYSQTQKRVVHVGVYVGNGKVIEARGVKYGVVETKLSERAWTHWGKFDWMTYDIPAEQGAVVQNETAQNDAGDPVAAKETPYYAVCSGSTVNVRTGRGTTFSSIGYSRKGDALLAMPELDNWCAVAVVLGGQMRTGYMYASYVKKV